MQQNSVLNLKKMPQKRMECFRLLFDHLALNRASVFEWHKRFKEGWESVRDDERRGRSKEVNTLQLIGQRVRVRVTMLRFEGSSGRDYFGRGQHSSNRVSGISTRTIHQSTTPSLSQTIWPRWASRRLFTLPIVQTLVPVTFAYSLSSEAIVMRQLRRWKSPVTKVIDTLTQEDFRRAIKKLLERYNKCVAARRNFFEWGLEFHVFTINKSAHTKKVWKLI